MIYKPDDDTRIVFDEITKTSKVYSLSELRKEIDNLTIETTNKELVTDEQLLSWAKENYPNSNEVYKLNQLRQELLKAQSLLEEIK